MGLDEGCKQVTMFLEDFWNGIKDLPPPKTEAQCANAKQLGNCADMVSIIGAKLACPNAEHQAELYGKIKADLFIKLMACDILP